MTVQMTNTSINQRAVLQAQIWKIANEVRGAVDGWDFKQFVLGTLFKSEMFHCKAHTV